MTKQQEKDRSKLLELDAESYDMTPEEKEQDFRGMPIIIDRSISREQREENARKDKKIRYLTIALVAIAFFLLIIL